MSAPWAGIPAILPAFLAAWLRLDDTVGQRNQLSRELLMHWPSRLVWRRTAIVAVWAGAVSISISTGVRMAIGAEADLVTVLVRITLPFLIALPLGLFWFTRLERLEESYKQLLADAAELARRASVDPLTGLLNRRSFVEQFNLSQHHGIAGIFLLADVDDLKQINDRLGHLAGDEAIVSVAEALRERLGDKALIARIGGDEFCAFSPRSQEGAGDLDIDAISKAATRKFRARLGDNTVELGTSIGTVRASKGLDFNNAIAASDTDLYRNKAARKAIQPEPS